MTTGFFYLAVLLALCVTLPFRIRAGISVALSDLVAFPAAACLVVEALRSLSVRRQLSELYRSNRVVYWYMGWTLFTAVVGLVRSTDVAQNVKDLVPAFVLYSLVGLTVDRRSRLRALLIATGLGLGCNAILGIMQGTLGGPYVTATSPGLEGKLDLSGNLLAHAPVGLLAHPNGLAILLLPAALFLIALLRTKSEWRTPLVSALLVVGFVFVLAQVKGAFAFLAVGVLLVFLPRRWERARLSLGLILPAVAIVAIMWFTITRFLEGEDAFGTLVTRLELWNRALEIIQTDRFTQVFGNAYPIFGVTSVGSFDYPNAHNAWLNHVLSFGLPGLALYLGCFIAGMRLSCRELRCEGPLRAAFVACFASLAAMVGESFFEPTDRGEIFSSQMMLVLALVVVLPRATRIRRLT
ncbi:MAG: O-antigen ligase family protein [Kofleriaceae bacterium]